MGTVYNMPPPTQGLVSLLILGDLRPAARRRHGPGRSRRSCTPASKRPSRRSRPRPRTVCRPGYMTRRPQRPAGARALDRAMAAGVDRDRAAPWGQGLAPGRHGLDGRHRRQRRRGQFHPEHLPRVRQRPWCCPDTGINWQNRGCSFSLDPQSRNPLTPGQQAVPHAESGAGAIRRRPHDGLRQHGRRRPAAEPGRGVQPHRDVRHGPAGRRSARRAGCSAARGAT